MTIDDKWISNIDDEWKNTVDDVWSGWTKKINEVSVYSKINGIFVTNITKLNKITN